jgi:hypothetical protein
MAVSGSVEVGTSHSTTASAAVSVMAGPCSVMHRQFVERESTFANLDAARAYLEAFVRCYPLALAQDQPRGEALVV